MEYGIISLVPVCIALVLAFWTKDALLSLLIGCLIGIVIMGQNIITGFTGLLQNALGNADFIWVLAIEVFIGILVAYFQKSGAIKAFADKVDAMNLTRKGAESMAFALGIFIFFSDYFSPLYVGNVMRPITDKAKASREFLAYVCDSTSAPICCLIPFTSWGIYVAGLLVGIGCITDSQIGQDVVVHAAPFNFYCIFALLLCGLLGCGVIPHYGPMKKAEKRALEEGKPYADGATPLLSKELEQITPDPNCKANLLVDFLMPAIIIIGITVGTYVILGSAKTLEAFVVAVAYQFITILLQKKATVKVLMDTAIEGIKSVMAAILILAMAYCMNAVTKDLGTAQYIIGITEAWMTPMLLLVITFIVCAIISFLTGSSWGTYAIMIPIAMPLAFALTGGELGTVVYAAVGTVMGGGCFGDNIQEGVRIAKSRGFNAVIIDGEDSHKRMEEMLETGEIQGAVTMHYPFPIGVSTVGRVITPGRGKEMFLAATTGTSATERAEAMVRNAIYGIIAAKACGISNPTVGIANIDGARQTEKILKKLAEQGYGIRFAESARADGGIVMRGNDLLEGTADVMVMDALTGNLMMKIFSAYTTGGQFESLGFGYGPGVGENYQKTILIVSRASGAPVIAGAVQYATELLNGNFYGICEEEMKKAYQAGLEELLCELKTEKNTEKTKKVAAPPKETVTHEIHGIEVVDLEDAAAALWDKDIYAETGMGCTGPVILVNDGKGTLARQILKEKGYIV